MKFFASIIILLFTLQLSAQDTIMYFDHLWNRCEPPKASFYGMVKKTDSGWLRHDYFAGNSRMQMQALYEDSACTIQNGNAIYFYPNGRTSSINRQVHNKREGVYLSFHSNGMMKDSGMYHNDSLVGYSLSWYPNGYLLDSVAPINDSTDIHVGWFDNGKPSFTGYLLHGEMSGNWLFFHRNGKLAAKEVYKNGSAIFREFYNEDGILKSDTTGTEIPFSYKGKGNWRAWNRYLNAHLYAPRGLEFPSGTVGVVVLRVIIAEDGKLESVEIDTPLIPELDDIALNTVKQSSPWRPAVSHNRKVKSVFRQVITFRKR